MTYWPISSPSVFAATKETRTKSTLTSDDGTKSGKNQDDDAESSVADSEERTKSETSGEGHGVGRDSAPVEKPGTEHVAEDDVSGEIRAIEVTRSGHMFATITRSTLTIWQTKVCLYFPYQRVFVWSLTCVHSPQLSSQPFSVQTNLYGPMDPM
jgi:hypothetical protein